MSEKDSTWERIYHIAVRDSWQQAVLSGAYEGDTLLTEGFIHCSTGQQVNGTANRYYAGRTDLILLEIDVAKVKPEIRYEAAPQGDLFPHIYGPLNCEAVTNVLEIQPNKDGQFHILLPSW